MLLALLMLVVGLLVGLLSVLVLDMERSMGGGPPPMLSCDGALLRIAGGAKLPKEDEGGTLDRPCAGGGVNCRSGGVPLTDRGPALGGGGVAALASTCSAPGFLLTQRLSSGSYTKLLASPSLALMGLPGDPSSPGLPPSFLEPPNQLEKPHPFLACCAAAARLAIDG